MANSEEILFLKKSVISRQIRANINISVTKSQFPKNYEKCNNSSANCPNKLTFGHKVLLRGPQKVWGEFSKFWIFAPFLTKTGGTQTGWVSQIRGVKSHCQLCSKRYAKLYSLVRAWHADLNHWDLDKKRLLCGKTSKPTSKLSKSWLQRRRH